MTNNEKKLALVGIFQTEFHRRLDRQTETCRYWFDWIVQPQIDMPIVVEAIRRLAADRVGRSFNDPPGLSEVQWMYKRCCPKTPDPVPVEEKTPDCQMGASADGQPVSLCDNSGIVWILFLEAPGRELVTRAIPCKCHHGVQPRDDCFPLGTSLMHILHFCVWAWKQPMYKTEAEAREANSG